MELPIDHFRLIGVAPTAETEAVLRAFQLRLDKIPDEGFTNEAIVHRAELLRLSADLLSDKELRQDYETALWGGASGLEFSSNREVAGLILLWEAEASLEAFELAKKGLQPPQAPALGSGRESDLTLVAALSCKSAAQEEQEQRRYESAALILQEGIQLLQRMGKLPDHRLALERHLEELLPYRILDLVSRELGDQSSHQEGIRLLDFYVKQRGGLEGKNLTGIRAGLDQEEFELFFQQIRSFLTVQEQIDLFTYWQKKGSPVAGFLGAIALVADGFSRRKPERLQASRKYFRSLDLKGVDSMPLFGCMDLLLADVEQAENKFKNSSDRKLADWLDDYPGEILEALCDYCRNWLKNDVLPGYRDVDANAVDLEAWFADRDVQKFVENIERKGALGIAKSGFSFLSSFTGDQDQETSLLDELNVEDSLPMPGGEPDNLSRDEDNVDFNKFLIEFFSRKIAWAGSILYNFRPSLSGKRISFLGFFSRIIFTIALITAGSSAAFLLLKNRPSEQNITNQKKVVGSLVELVSEQDGEDSVKDKINDQISNLYSQPLIVENPTLDEVRQLLESWLASKAVILAGGQSDALPSLVRPTLMKLVQKERDKDLALGQAQIIDAKIDSLTFVKRSPKRLEVKASLVYRDKRVNSSSEIVSETYIPRLAVTYILGREKDIWKLVAYISGR